MIRILVADKIAPEGLSLLEREPDVEVAVHTGLDDNALAAMVPEFDGMIIRSGVTVTACCLAHPGRLRAITRAGVGVDNVDLEAATNAGVLVMNTPDANTVSTAEHAFALLLAAMRHVPDAHAHVRSGKWQRSAYMGRQLAGKTMGIVGLGRVGRAVAERALGFKMRVVGFDPLIGSDTLFDGAVKLFDKLDEMLAAADCVTLHAKVTDQTRGMIGAAQLAKMKPTALLVNCARGELTDEAALAECLNNDGISGAAIDVYTVEPPEGSPLLSARNVVLSPHLGASTKEAQLAVSIEAVEALLHYLRDGEIRSAVNVVGLPTNVTSRDRAYLDLCDRMGSLLSIWCDKGLARLKVTTRGDALSALCPTLARQVIVALLSPHIDARLNLVSAEAVARERDISIDYAAHGPTDEYGGDVIVNVTTRDGEHSIEGTVFGDGRPRIFAIDEYRMEIVPERHVVLIFNDDRPGVIGLVGKVFGDHGVNIADMALSRRERTALMLLKLDQEPGADVFAKLRASKPILSVRSVELPPLREVGESA